MKARRLPSGNWICEGFYVDPAGNRRRKSFTAQTKKAAEDLAHAFRIRADYVGGETVSACLERYIDQRRPVLSPATIRTYMTHKRHLEEFYPHFTNMAAADIDLQAVQSLINELSKTHSPKTVRNYHGLLTASLPGRLSILRSVTLPQKKRPDYHIPTSEAVQAILRVSEGTDLEVPILLAAICTMRSGEICALELSDIEKNRIHVSKSLTRGEGYKWYIKAPKTYSSDRFIDAPDWVIKKIKKQGLPDYTPDTLTKAFRRLLEVNNLPHIRFHDLRHYSASYMHASGVPTAYIMKRGGWSSETVLNEVYRHALDDEDKRQTEKINAGFSELFS